MNKKVILVGLILVGIIFLIGCAEDALTTGQIRDKALKTKNVSYCSAKTCSDDKRICSGFMVDVFDNNKKYSKNICCELGKCNPSTSGLPFCSDSIVFQ